MDEAEAEYINHTLYEFYDGSKFLMPVSEFLGTPIDQVNFFFAHLAAIASGSLFRVLFPPKLVGPHVRHIIQICLGIAIIYFCYGRQIVHVLAQSLGAYLLMASLRVGIMEKVVLCYAVGYLSCCHIYRMIYDYGGYTLDITGPLMINTQKLSSLAFNLHDGNVDKSKVTDFMKRLSLKDLPRLHEFLSYVFCFHSLMCGPFCFYNDYVTFVDGSHFGPNYSGLPPSPVPTVIRKLLVAAFFGMLTLFVAPYWPCTLLTGRKFAEENFLYKNFLVVFVSCLHRYKYYFAWALGEASNISAGLGFNGYNKKGIAKWDLIDNADILETEFALNMKQFIDNWNKSTLIWLRFVVYERTHSTMMVFAFSAIWHGFYPGYYVTFLSAGLFVLVARKVRKVLRHHFQATQLLSITYDVATFLITSISMCYIGFPFMLLLPNYTFYVYWHLCFYQHIIAIIILVCFSPMKDKLTNDRARSD